MEGGRESRRCGSNEQPGRLKISGKLHTAWIHPRRLGNVHSVSRLSDCIGPLSPKQPMTMGELAQRTGMSAKAIRHYESIGVLPRPQRQANGSQRYGMADVNRLLLLHHIRLASRLSCRSKAAAGGWV